MSHHAHLLTDLRKRAPHQTQPFDSMTKAELWERLQAAEKAMAAASASAQTAATLAHNYAQGASGMDRRAFLAIRDAAYKARDDAHPATKTVIGRRGRCALCDKPLPSHELHTTCSECVAAGKLL